MSTLQKGFTLIELVVVITIIAILAAVAMPKFTNLQRDARIAKLSAARGAIGSAAALVHATYLPRAGVADAAVCPGGGAIPATNAVSGTLCVEGGLVQLANGYPDSATALAAATPGIIGAAGLASVFSPSLAQLNAEGFNVTVGATAAIQVTGGSNAANCSFTYSAAAANAAPVISAVTTTGC